MKRAVWGLLAALAGVVGLAACWLAKQMLEGVAQEGIRGAVSRVGPVGEGLVALAVGLGLLLVGPAVMARENRMRLAQERRPRYRGVEFGVVIVGGLVFSAFGFYQLLGWR